MNTIANIYASATLTIKTWITMARMWFQAFFFNASAPVQYAITTAASVAKKTGFIGVATFLMLLVFLPMVGTVLSWPLFLASLAVFSLKLGFAYAVVWEAIEQLLTYAAMRKFRSMFAAA